MEGSVVLSNARHTGILFLSAHLQLEQAGLGVWRESCGCQGEGLRWQLPCQVGSAGARNCQGTLGARLGADPPPEELGQPQAAQAPV